MNRRQFTGALGAAVAPGGVHAAAPQRPNVIYIILDDLGMYDTGCYGSKQIQTPHIDRLAAEGMKFEAAYSGCTVCAPARATLMTGRHMGHSSVRANPGGTPLAAGDVTLAQVLKQAGYTCGGFGKWGLGDIGTDGVPEKHGFDRFFGYYHQVHAHHYYPDYLIDTGKKAPLPGNRGVYGAKAKVGAYEDEGPGGAKRQFSASAIQQEMLQWIRAHRDRPFFCYAPWTIPHGLHEIPESDPAWKLYRDKPWSVNARVHAAFVTMADRFVGETMDLLKQSGLDSNTLVCFSSDNGASDTFEGALDSGGILRGKKTNLYEGGIRVPFLARLPGRIRPGSRSDAPVYFPDVMPTVAELTGTSRYLPKAIDGISLAPELTGNGRVSRERPMYWEWNDGHFNLPYHVKMQACRKGRWKVVRHDVTKPWELYDLSSDPGEKQDVAARNPRVVAELDAWVRAQREDPPEQFEPSKPAGQQWR